MKNKNVNKDTPLISVEFTAENLVSEPKYQTIVASLDVRGKNQIELVREIKILNTSALKKLNHEDGDIIFLSNSSKETKHVMRRYEKYSRNLSSLCTVTPDIGGILEAVVKVPGTIGVLCLRKNAVVTTETFLKNEGVLTARVTNFSSQNFVILVCSKNKIFRDLAVASMMT